MHEEVLGSLKGDHRRAIDDEIPISHHGSYEVLAKVTEGLWKTVADLARDRPAQKKVLETRLAACASRLPLRDFDGQQVLDQLFLQRRETLVLRLVSVEPHR